MFPTGDPAECGLAEFTPTVTRVLQARASTAPYALPMATTDLSRPSVGRQLGARPQRRGHPSSSAQVTVAEYWDWGPLDDEGFAALAAAHIRHEGLMDPSAGLVRAHAARIRRDASERAQETEIMLRSLRDGTSCGDIESALQLPTRCVVGIPSDDLLHAAATSLRRLIKICGYEGPDIDGHMVWRARLVFPPGHRADAPGSATPTPSLYLGRHDGRLVELILAPPRGGPSPSDGRDTGPPDPHDSQDSDQGGDRGDRRRRRGARSRRDLGCPGATPAHHGTPADGSRRRTASRQRRRRRPSSGPHMRNTGREEGCTYRRPRHAPSAPPAPPSLNQDHSCAQADSVPDSDTTRAPTGARGSGPGAPAHRDPSALHLLLYAEGAASAPASDTSPAGGSGSGPTGGPTNRVDPDGLLHPTGPPRVLGPTQLWGLSPRAPPADPADTDIPATLPYDPLPGFEDARRRQSGEADTAYASGATSPPPAAAPEEGQACAASLLAGAASPCNLPGAIRRDVPGVAHRPFLWLLPHSPLQRRAPFASRQPLPPAVVDRQPESMDLAEARRVMRAMPLRS